MSDCNLRNLWCRFVLSEGIIPASLARNLKKDENQTQDVKLLAQILQNREMFSKPSYTELNELVSKAFQNDDELCNWLKKIEKIITVIINFADADENTISILNGAFMSFVKSCPLVSEQVKTSYLTVFNADSFSPPVKIVNKRDFISAIKQNAFVEYLKEKCNSMATVNSYKSAVNVTSKIIGKNIWLISDYVELQQLIDSLTIEQSNETQENKKLRLDFGKKNHHNALSGGLLKYKDYLLSVKK